MFFGPFTAVALTVRATASTVAMVVPTAPVDDRDRGRNLDERATAEDAEIVRKTTIKGERPRDTPDRKIPTTGIGSFVVGDDDGEWIESDGTVRLEGWR